MPTTKPRLILTLTRSQHDTFKRLAAFQGRPMSKVVTELLTEIEPMLQSAVAALDEIQRKKAAPAKALAIAITRMQGAVEQLAEHATGQMDLLTRRDEISAERERSEPPRTPAKRNGKAVKGRKRGGRT